MSWTKEDEIRSHYKMGEQLSKIDAIKILKEKQKELEGLEKHLKALESIEKWEEYAPAWKGNITEADLEKMKPEIKRNIEYWKGLINGMSDAFSYGDYSNYLEHEEPKEFERIYHTKSRYLKHKKKVYV